MAEVIGIAASIVTLTSLVRTTIEIARQGSKIPKQIEQVIRELEELLVQLEFLQNVQLVNDLSPCLGPSVTSSLRDSLDRNIAELRSIEDYLGKLSSRYKGTKGHICWLLVGKNEVLSQLKRLQEMRSALNLTLSLLNTALNLVQLASTNKFGPLCKTFPFSSFAAAVATDTSAKPCCSQSLDDVSKESRYTASWPKRSKPSTTYTTSVWIPSLGRIVFSFLEGRSTTSRYELAFWLALPYSRVLIVRALLLWPGWLSFSMNSSFRMSRVVDHDSALHRACVSGEVLQIERLLLEDPAAIHDLTQDNQSPLQMAICSRSCSAVRLLLEHGADVNALFGQNQTSPLALAIQTRNTEIVRLLLAHHADCHHVGSYGWTPLFYLWWGESNQFTFVDQAEAILQVLASRCDFLYTYSGVIDDLSFTAIHMAVMRGTISQVRFLLGQDPNLVQIQGFLGWTAVHVAVSEGRLDMLELLLPFYDRNEIITAKDARGWTLLHTSAAEGASDVTRQLLKMRVDWQALSDPSMIEVPPKLEGRSCTPLEAASAVSVARRIDYLNNVKDIFGKSCLSDDELEELNETWSDATSVIV